MEKEEVLGRMLLKQKLFTGEVIGLVFVSPCKGMGS